MIKVRDKEHLALLLSESEAAFMFSDESFQIVTKAFQSAVKGNQYISAKLSKYMLTLMASKKEIFSSPVIKAKLTAREKEIVALIVDGLSSKDIAEKLSISVNTVETHRQNILKKLELKNVAALIKYATH